MFHLPSLHALLQLSSHFFNKIFIMAQFFIKYDLTKRQFSSKVMNL